MAKTVSKKRTVKKTTKTESKYYIVNSLNGLTKQVTETAQQYNDKLVAPSVKATRETIELMQKDPKKAVTQIKDDGLGLAEDIRSNVDSKVRDWMADGKDFFKGLYENPQEMVGGYFKDGRKWTDETVHGVREVIENVAKDGKMMVTDVRSNPSAAAGDLFQAGKKYVEVLPGMNRVEERVEKAAQLITESFNLSTKNDLKKLTNAMNRLNKKVDKLSNQLPGPIETPAKQ